MINEPCSKIILANSLGVKLIYCQNCNVVELETGAISLRFCPDVIQQIANMMMKASLQLDHITAVSKVLNQKESSLISSREMIH
jgi:hypothetical protein